jgi:hypothetical protein
MTQPLFFSFLQFTRVHAGLVCLPNPNIIEMKEKIENSVQK